MNSKFEELGQLYHRYLSLTKLVQQTEQQIEELLHIIDQGDIQVDKLENKKDE